MLNLLKSTDVLSKEVMAVGMILDDGYDSVNKNLGSNKQQQASANKKKEIKYNWAG